MTGICIKQLWPWWLLLPTCFGFWTKYTVDYDSMRVARCYSKCDRYPSINECMDNCLLSNYTKPGQCPEENSMSPFEAVCLIACTNDSQCTDLGKCCANDCGITCMHPTGLQEHEDLPPVPDGIEIRREKSNMVLLNWMSKDPRISDGDNGVWYVVEERHVLGPRYLESRLSSWDVLHMSSKPYASIKAGLKTGHWYQFRVAAVNENGSRGYSIPSKPFKTAEPRNPREPRNLSLSGARVQQADGKLRILLRWRQPPSDVPIMFYKLFWSQLIRGPTNESILIYHRSISKDKSCFEIKNLEIGCQYFLQVQAVSVYGGRRMASKKASKVFNSTDYSKYADVDGHAGRCERHHAGLRVRRLICHCNDEVDARLVWPIDTEAHSYNVSWRLESCSTFHNSKITPNLIAPSSLSHITQKTRFDIKNLEKNCTYAVNVRSVINNNNNNDNNSNNNKKYNNELGQNDNNWQDINDERNLSIELTTNVNCNKIRQNRNNNNTNNNNNSSNNNNNDLKMTKCKKRKARIKKIYNKFL